MPPDVEHLLRVNQIEKDALILVGHLHTCCKDAGLQVTQPTDYNYVFSALHKHEIRIRGNASNELFYIWFGEKICKLADDSSIMPTTKQNTAQTPQQRSKEVMAQDLRDQFASFLEHLT